VFGVIVASAINRPGDAGMSLLIIALGVPVYYVWRCLEARKAV
jgi:APA family basic amino acid/polyamine antiporter